MLYYDYKQLEQNMLNHAQLQDKSKLFVVWF